jgi:hypothetical protein
MDERMCEEMCEEMCEKERRWERKYVKARGRQPFIEYEAPCKPRRTTSGMCRFA